MRPLILASAAVAAAAATAGAAEAQGLGVAIPGIELGVSAGTLGVGPELALRDPGGLLGVRLDAHLLALNHGVTRGGMRYEAKAELASGGATLDLYPFRTGFRLSAGARLNGNSATLDATPAGRVRFNGAYYEGAAVGGLRGKATFESFAPYVGIGYSHAFFGGRMPVSIDAGAMFQGPASVRLSASGPLASNAAFLQDLEAESRRVRNALNTLQVFPVVKLTVAYRF